MQKRDKLSLVGNLLLIITTVLIFPLFIINEFVKPKTAEQIEEEKEMAEGDEKVKQVLKDVIEFYITPSKWNKR